MEAVFGLLKNNPGDDQLLIAASAVADQLGKWADVLPIISVQSPVIDLTSKTYLRTFTRALRGTRVSQWPLHHIETVMVAGFPRWGSLIPKDSLSDLFDLLNVVITHGVGLFNNSHGAVSLGLSKTALDETRAIKLKLLQIIWFSSALSTLTTVLKCGAGDGDAEIVNVLLRHNSGTDSLKQTVVEAQEKALLCLGSLFECVSSKSRDECLNQLCQILKSLGSEFPDSSSLPLVMSVGSFLVGGFNLKVRPETVDAAAFCMKGIFDLCELSPSLFQLNTRVKGEQIITACLEAIKERGSDACVSLLGSLSLNLPSICLNSKSLAEGMQQHQALYRVAAALVPELPIPIAACASGSYTSGRALALARSNEKEKMMEFLTGSVMDPNWLKSNFLPSAAQLEELTNLYSLMQSMRVRPECAGNPIHEPSVEYLLRGASVDLSGINKILGAIESCGSLIDACMVLTTALFELKPSASSDFVQDLKNSILALLPEIETDAVRETPQLVEKILALLELVAQQELAGGLAVVKQPADSTTDDKKGDEIIKELVLSILSFAKNKNNHASLVNQSLRCVPYFPLVGDSVIIAITQSVSASLALSSIPATLTCLEALLESCSSDSTGVQQHVLRYLCGLLYECSRQGEIDDTVTVSFLSLMASVLLVFPLSSASFDCASLWSFLACHPSIRAAATASSWDQTQLQYTVKHLVWIQTLHVAEVLLTHACTREGVNRFVDNYHELLTERFRTAHTSDLASLEEACLIARVAELAGNKKILLTPFQFTSLLTPKPPSMYPKSRAEKLAGGLPALNIADDVRSPCETPSVFAQRVVWIAADILSSSLRSIGRYGSPDTQSTQTLFHSLLDCSHFVVKFLYEVAVHKSRVLKVVQIGSHDRFIPLSVHLSVDGRDFGVNTPLPPQKHSSSKVSLLDSMSSPLSKAKEPTASLMDSLTPRNSPKGSPASVPEEIRFLPAVAADCSIRTGLSFIAPSLVAEEDFVHKLVEVLSLCLILASNMAATEALIRPLLDLLLTTQSNKERLPAEAMDIINELVDFITPKYERLAALGKSKNAPQQALSGPTFLSSQFPALNNSPLGYAAISNIR